MSMGQTLRTLLNHLNDLVRVKIAAKSENYARRVKTGAMPLNQILSVELKHCLLTSQRIQTVWVSPINLGSHDVPGHDLGLSFFRPDGGDLTFAFAFRRFHRKYRADRHVHHGGKRVAEII